MSFLLLCSATGSPGVTTTALGLALTWPTDVLVSDCDRDPSQSIEAGHLRGMSTGGRGLAGIARAHRERRPLGDEVMAQTVALDAGEHPRRRFLPGFSHPAAANVFDPIWPDLAQTFAEVSASGTDVLVDAGRVGRSGLPAPLLASCDMVLMVVRSSLRSLAAARLHLGGLVEQVEAEATRAEVGLCLIGAGMPYGEREIAEQFRVPVLVGISYSPAHAAVLSDGAPVPRRHDDGALLRSYRSAAQALQGGLLQRENAIESGSAREWQSRIRVGGRR